MCQEVVFLEALLKNCQKKKQENTQKACFDHPSELYQILLCPLWVMMFTVNFQRTELYLLTKQFARSNLQIIVT